MPDKHSGSAAFMQFTGRLRSIFGPAQVTSLDHDMTDENKRLLAELEDSAQQWQTVRRADGSTYIVRRSDY